MNVLNRILLRVSREIRRIKSIHHAYDFSAENAGWHKYEVPVLGGKKEGTYFDPCVIGQEGFFEMYVSHRDTGTIIKCTSEDGVYWTNNVTVLAGQKNSDWEERVNRVSVLKKADICYMWYTGQSETKSMIGLATSSDGLHFEKYKGNPVICPTETYEQQSVMNPCVIWDEAENIFKMWYSAGEKYEPDVLCYATSKDGVLWKKYSENPILQKGINEYDKAKVGGCDVIKQGGEYVMFYIGYQNIDNARICMAESRDGINWIRNRDNPIISPSKNKWDSHAVYKPAICYNKINDTWYLWYNGRNKNQECIGLARKKGKL